LASTPTTPEVGAPLIAFAAPKINLQIIQNMSEIIQNASNMTAIIDNRPSQPEATSKMLNIRKPLNLPPAGVNRGVFFDVNILPEDLGPDKKPRELLKLDVSLEALDANGKSFVVSKYYNLRARGLRTLNEDLRDWCGEYLVPECEATWEAGVFLGRPLVVTIQNRKQGSLWITSIVSLHPADALGKPEQSAA